MAKSDLCFYLEFYGDSHNNPALENDANMIALDMLKKLQAAGFQINQCRFTSSRGEENWLDGVSVDMHQELQDALRKPNTAEVGTQSGGDQGSGGTDQSGGVGSLNQGTVTSGTKASRKS